MDMGARRERARHRDAHASYSSSDSARSQASSVSRQRNVERRPDIRRKSPDCQAVEDTCAGSHRQSRGESGFVSGHPNEDDASCGSRLPSAETSSVRSRVSSEESSRLRHHHHHHHHHAHHQRGAGGSRDDSMSGSGGTSYGGSDIEDDNIGGGCGRGRSGSCAPSDHTHLPAMSSSQPRDSFSCCCCCCCCSSECSTERTGSGVACGCCACRDQQVQVLQRLRDRFESHSDRGSERVHAPGSTTRKARGHRLHDVCTAAADGREHNSKRGSASGAHDDREAAGRAVALVINGARRGFVPLCVDVAGLLRSRRRLRRMVESQALEIERLRQLLGHAPPVDDSTAGSGAPSAERCRASPRRCRLLTAQGPHCALPSHVDWDEAAATGSDVNGTEPDSRLCPPGRSVAQDRLRCAALEEAIAAGKMHRAEVHSAAEQVAARLGSLSLREEAREGLATRGVDETSGGSTCRSACADGQTAVGVGDKQRGAQRKPPRPDLSLETRNLEAAVRLSRCPPPSHCSATCAGNPPCRERDGRAAARIEAAAGDRDPEGASTPGLEIIHSFDPGGEALRAARRSTARDSHQAEPSSAPRSNGALGRLKRFQLSQLTGKLRR